MATAKATVYCDLNDKSKMAAAAPQPRDEYCDSDCWPSENEDSAATEAPACENTPAIVFGDIMHLLAMTFITLTAIGVCLKVFHLH
jgi:hypothetical protein